MKINNRGIEIFDNLPPEEAIVKAWVEPGVYPNYHNAMKSKVRQQMPVLVRAIERLVGEKSKEFE